jgi:hypothetical protein
VVGSAMGMVTNMKKKNLGKTSMVRRPEDVSQVDSADVVFSDGDGGGGMRHSPPRRGMDGGGPDGGGNPGRQPHVEDGTEE